MPLDQLIFTVAVSGAHFHEEFRSRDMVIFFGLKDKSMTSPLLTGDDNPNDQIMWLKNDTMQSSSSSSRSPLMATNNSSLTASTRRTLTSLSTSGSASVPSLQSKSSQKSYKTELSQEEQMKRMSNFDVASKSEGS